MSAVAGGAGIGRRVTGWIGVGLVSIVACLWAWWGGIEGFHEGWYARSLLENIGMTLVQYWLVALVFVGAGLLCSRLPRAGLAACILLGVGAALFFTGARFSVSWLLIVLPFAAVGLLFLFGRPSPPWLAGLLVSAPALAILLVTGIVGIARVSQRVDDADYGVRVVEGSGARLAWAPRGPGWPGRAATYREAADICARLSEDGMTVLDREVRVWRLPSVEEAVRSQALHGRDAGGAWDPVTRRAAYRRTPDKETPLWDPHSPVIYYWTSTMADDGKAYIIVYHGGVFTRGVEARYASLSFRAVKDIPR
jgi:hypothetical protein